MTEVSVVGGGLAGMGAALRLAQRGYGVTLYDAGVRLGGKAGADEIDGRREDHGFHILPEWYENVWALVDELGIRDRFSESGGYLDLDPGRYPTFRAMRNITSLSHLWRNLTSGYMPMSQEVLFFYACVDLMSQPYSRRRALDEVTVTGFLRSRFYMTDAVASLFQDLVLKGLSLPSSYLSAMTLRIVLRYWAKKPVPMYRILKGDMQTELIDPVERLLREAGCRIELRQRLRRVVVRHGRVAGIELESADGATVREEPVERLVLALPAEKTAAIVDDELYAVAPRLAGVSNIRVRAMPALDVFLRERLPDMPSVHVNLIGSRLGLSFIDVSQTWSGMEGSALNAIAANASELGEVSDEEAVRVLLDELAEYVPGVRDEDIRATTYRSHRDEPLFMNDAGAWEWRLEGLPASPTDRVGPENLYVAGDHCRSDVDLVCMEGALSTGLKAAAAVVRDAGRGAPVEILTPPVHPRALMVAVRVLGAPVAALARAWVSLRYRGG